MNETPRICARALADYQRQPPHTRQATAERHKYPQVLRAPCCSAHDEGTVIRGVLVTGALPAMGTRERNDMHHALDEIRRSWPTL